MMFYKCKIFFANLVSPKNTAAGRIRQAYDLYAPEAWETAQQNYAAGGNFALK